mgnify:CR=1 FL=1
MFSDIYHEYLLYKNEENRLDRYKGKEDWYHASGAGLCSRKLYYESVEKAEPTNPPSKASLRRMRVGTIIHEDLQKSLTVSDTIYNTKYNIHVQDSIQSLNIRDITDVKFDVEGEINLKGFNVRGYYDVLLLVSSAGSTGHSAVKLYDMKTAASYSYKLKFSRTRKQPQENRNHYLQLGTYGIGIMEQYGRLDGMSILYYNKDTSAMREVVVPISYVDNAKRYWHVINEEHAKGLPNFNIGSSPVYTWVCNYCQFKNHCKPPF